MGIGMGLGALAGGMIYRWLGLQAVFAISAGVLAVGWAVCTALDCIFGSNAAS